ncbi:flippase [Dyadobacter crusticola]|uniref:flippase n=1 Tax=Dyadobacter crusticola TaxID=292407 RepID=UPI00068A456D|nr:flippase [Dyadobacter crusticola]
MRNTIDKSDSGVVSKFSTLINNPTIRKYAFNTSWLFSEQILRMAVGLFVGVWVARFLGPANFGILNYAQSLVGLFGAVATLGLNNIVIRELVNKKVDENLLLGTAFVMKLVGAFVVMTLLAITINIIPTDSYTKLIVMITSASTIFQSVNVIDFYFQSKVQSKFVVYVNFVVLLISTLLKLLFLFLKASVEVFAIIVVVETIVSAIGLIYFYKKNKADIRQWKFNTNVAVKLLRDSWPLILSSISISIGMRIDQVMLKSYINETSVGYYAVGVKFAEIFNFIPMLISQSIYPKIIEMDLVKERNKLIAMLRYIFMALALLGIGVNIFSGFAVNLLYGAEYEPSIAVVNILIWSIPFTFLNIVTSTILQKLNKNSTILIRQLIIAGINILVNMYLIPRYDIAGASMGTLIADMSLFIFGFLIPNERAIFFLRLEALLFIKTDKIGKLI